MSEAKALFLASIAGASFSALGGFLAVLFQNRVSKKEKILHIKIGLTDELTDIDETITKLKNTFDAERIISPTYFPELQTQSEAFNFHRETLYLIGKKALRHDICAFYKKLGKKLAVSSTKVLVLDKNAPTSNEHTLILADMNEIQTEAGELKTKIEKYRYTIIPWFFI